MNTRFLRQSVGVLFLLLGVLTAEGVLAGGRFVLGFTDAVRAALVQFNFVRFPKSSASSE